MPMNVMKKLAGNLLAASMLSVIGSTAFAQTPLDPVTVYEEDFEGVATLPGELSDVNFTADVFWADTGFCNGILLDNATATSIETYVGSGGTCGANSINQLGAIAAALGGGDDTNVVASSYTQGSGGPARGPLQLQTPQISLTNNRFYRSSVDIGVINCQAAADPMLSFELTNGVDSISLGPEVDGCDAQTEPVQVNAIESPLAVRWSLGSTANLQLFNSETGNGGNDSAVDNLLLEDVTPDLYKAFSPTENAAGQPVDLTFTIVNKSDLLEKLDMGFTDTLTAGLEVVPGATPVNTCEVAPGSQVVAVPPQNNDPAVVTASGSTITVSGVDLALGETSCTITVQVRALSVGAFDNGAGDVSGLSFINPPNTATLTSTAPEAEDDADSILFGATSTFDVATNDTDFAGGDNAYAIDGGTATGATIDGNGEVVWDSTGFAPGAYTVDYEICNADLNPTLCSTATHTITVTASPSLAITKVADDTNPVSGQIVTYTYTVTNDGDVDVDDVVVTDTHGGAGTLGPITLGVLTNTSTNSSDDGLDAVVDTLAPGDSVTFTADYRVIAADEGNTVSNTAVADGDPVAGTLVPLVARTVTETIVVQDFVENFVLDTALGNQCSDIGGTLDGGNVFTAFDNGTLGFAADATPQSSPATNPFGVNLTGATYDEYPDTGFGEFTIVSNIQTARNVFQHGGGIFDPINGVAGRFFHIDPQNFTEFPAVNLSGLEVGELYEVSFWVADAELDALSSSRVSILADGATVFTTPEVDNGAANAPMIWTKYSFVVEATATTLEVVIRIVDEDLDPITNGTGRDIHMDEIRIERCDLGEPPVAGDETITSGTIETVTFDPIADLISDPEDNADPTSVEIVVDLGDFPAGTVLSADGKSLIVPGEGEWSVDPVSGVVTFAPADDLVGDPTPIGYTVSDDNGNEALTPGTLAIAYGEPPVAGDETIISDTIEAVTFDPIADLASDSDGNVDPTSVEIVVDLGDFPAGTVLSADGKSLIVPGEGEWSVDPVSGVVTFAPADDLVGDPTAIGYTVRDDDGNLSPTPGTLAVDYGEPPTADDQTIVSGEIAPVTFDPIADLTNDPDGNVVSTTVSLVAPSGATGVITDGAGDVLAFTIDGEGTWVVNPATGEITFTPEDGFVGDPAAVDYTVRDDSGNTSEPGTLAVDYGEPPVAGDALIVSGPIEPVTFDIIGDTLASDPDGSVDPTSVSLTPLPGVSDIVTDADGDVIGFTVPSEGIWSVNETTGAVTFTPEDGFAGDPTPVDYDVRDDDANPSVAPGTLSIDYGEPPVAEDDSAFSALIVPVTISPLGNDSDPDGGTLIPASVVLTETDLPVGGILSADGKTLTVPGEGEWTVVANGDITFTPEDNFDGSPTPVTYTVADDDGNASEPATLIVQYGEAPVAANNTVTDLPLGEPFTLDPLANDFDGDDGIDPTSVQLTLTGAPADAVLSADGQQLEVPGEGVWTVDPDTGAITFTPDDGYVGDPTPIRYTVDDFAGNTSNEATVTLEFQDPPIAVDDVASDFPVDLPVTINPLLNDSDPDGLVDPTLTVLLTIDNSPPGSVVSDGGKTLTVPGEGVWTVDPVSGDVTYTPQDGFRGSPTPVGYEITDVDGNVSNIATITLAFLAPPLAMNDGVSGITVGEPATLNPLANDSGTDSPLDPATVMLALNPETPAGAVLSGDGRTLRVPGEGVWTVDPATGAVTFTPEAGFTDNPTPVDYTVMDEEGQESNVATITFEYESTPPVAEDDVASGFTIGEAATLNPLVNDSDEDGTLEPTSVLFTGTDAPDGASVSADGKTLTVPGEGVWTIDPATGEVTFTPEDGFQENPTPVAYTVADNGGNVSNEALITLEYTPPTLLSGTVFVDTDNDGIFDTDEDGHVVPVLVSLLDEDGTIVATVTTDANGFYELSGFPLGTYTVTFTDPATGAGAAEPIGPITFTLEDSAVAEQNAPVISPTQAGTLLLTKSTPLSNVLIGSSVPYEITVTNATADAVTADLIDTLPVGLVYTPDSGMLDGVAVEPAIAGQTLTWSPVTIAASATVTLELVARVGPNAPTGDLTNVVTANDTASGEALATPATATVRRNPEAVFDCANVIGKVFDDVNGNGYQDAPGADVTFSTRGHDISDQDFFVDGKIEKFQAPHAPKTEPGIPGVRLVTTDGTVITTDAYGRYSVPCAALPSDIGANFTLKADVNSLPTGYRMTTENPRTMRLTAGIMTEMNFGAAIGRVIDIDLTASAFTGAHQPVAELSAGIDGVLAQVASEPAILRITYFTDGESAEVGRARLDALEDLIRAKWKRVGEADLLIERNTARLQ